MTRDSITELDWWERKQGYRHGDEPRTGKCVCGHPHGNHVQNKHIPTGGCLADLNDGICNCEQFSEDKR